MSTVAGGNPTGDGGAPTGAALNGPRQVAMDSSGNLYVADFSNDRIRKVTPGADGVIGQTNSSGQMVDTDDTITTVAGNGTDGFSGDGGPAANAELSQPSAVVIDGAGNLWIADSSNNRVRVVCFQASGCTLPAGAGGSIANGAIATIAGNGTTSESGNGGAATSAGLYYPVALAFDGAGNLFIDDLSFNTIRFVCLQATVCSNGNWYGTVNPGDIVKVAGLQSFCNCDSGDGGPAASAGLNQPAGVAVDPSTGNLFVAEVSGRIRKVTASTGIISTLSTGPGGGYFGPEQIQFVTTGGTSSLYIADGSGSYRVLALNLSTLAYTTIAGTSGTCGFSGDGTTATNATLCTPYGVVRSSSGEVFVGDTRNLRVRKVTASGIIVTVVGNGQTLAIGDGGPAARSGLSSPWDVAVDAAGDLYIADVNDDRVRFVCVKPAGCAVPGGTVAQGNITTVAGNGTTCSGCPGGDSGDGGPATSASTSSPGAVALDASGNLYVADYNGERVRFVCMQTTSCALPSGAGGPSVAPGDITTIAGTGIVGSSGDGGSASAATLSAPTSIAIDRAGNVYVVDGSSADIRFVCLQPSACTLLLGAAGPQLASGDITTIAGQPGSTGYAGDGGPADAALLSPSGVAVDEAGNLYIGDAGNNAVRFVCRQASSCGTASGPVRGGDITTVAGRGPSSGGFSGDGGAATAAMVDGPSDVALDTMGNLYISDALNQRVRFICMQTICPNYLSSTGLAKGDITTLAGNGGAGYTGDGSPANVASFNTPRGLALDASNNLFVADANNNRIREVSVPATPVPYATPVFPSFATQVGTASVNQSVTFTNPTVSTVNVWVSAPSGPNASNFSIVSNGCGTSSSATVSVAANGGTCAVQLAFASTGFGRFTASLTFNDGAATPPTASLSGLVDSTKVGAVGANLCSSGPPCGAVYAKQDAQSYQALNGAITATPTVVSVPGSAGSTPMVLYIGVGTDTNLYVRSDTLGWQAFAPPGTSCIDSPGATLTAASGGAYTLTIACQGSDHALWYAQTPVTAGTLPTIGSGGWTSLGGKLNAGPAVMSLGGQVTFIVTGVGGQLYQRRIATAYTAISGTCKNHVALATGAIGAYLACHGTDDGLWLAVNNGTGWGAFTNLGGVIQESPGIAVTAAGVTIWVEGSNTSLYHRMTDLAGMSPSGYVNDGGSVQFGAGGAGMFAS